MYPFICIYVSNTYNTYLFYITYLTPLYISSIYYFTPLCIDHVFICMNYIYPFIQVYNHMCI